MRTRLALSLLLALAGAAALPAQTRVVPNADEDTLGAGADTSARKDDRRFLEKASMLNNKEIVLSRIILERSDTPAVRAFADDMVREHTAARERLDLLAAGQGVKVDEEHAEQREKLEKKWSGLTGAELDEDYVETMIDGHGKMIETLEKGSRSTDADIAAFASELLPKVRSHLERAKELKKAIDD